MIYRHAVRGLAAAAAASFVLVAVCPGTAPVVQGELSFLRMCRETRWLTHESLSDIGFGEPPSQPEEIRRLLDRHPDDLQLQLAVASSPDTLSSLALRFPRSPAVLATLLSSELGRDVTIRRTDEAAFEQRYYDSGTPGPVASPPSPGLPGMLGETFDRDAASGERLDPHNAFFPMARAIGLFADNKDRRAMAEVLKAGRASYWENYENEASLGRLRVLDDGFGDRSAFPRENAVPGPSLNALAQVRQLARMVIFKAVMADRAGRPDEGIALRHALVRCGSQMAVSRSVMDSLVGIAVSAIGASSPERQSAGTGASKPHHPDTGKAYEQYLRRTGHPGEAAWVASQLAFGAQAKTVTQRAIDRPSARGSVFSSAMELVGVYAVGLALLANALWMLLAGGLSTLLLRRKERIGRLQFLLLPAAMAASLVLPWLLVRSDVPYSGADSWALLLALIAPGLVALVSGIVSVVRRAPLLTGITRGLAAAAIPAASVLLLSYSVLAVFAAPLDRRVSSQVTEQVQNETRFDASQVHETWPTRAPGAKLSSMAS